MNLDCVSTFIRIISNQKIRNLPIEFKHVHAYIQHYKQNFIFCFITSELLKMHSHCMHPSPGKLYHLLKIARPEQVSPKIKTMIKQISASCEACSTYSVPPFRFRTTIPAKEITFNRELAIFLMYLNKGAVLHVFDTATNFQNAFFLKIKWAEDIYQH